MTEGESVPPEFKAIQAKPPLFKYLAQTWERLPFSAYLAWYQVFTANARTKVGLGWVILRPLLNAGVYGVIFGLLLGSSRPPNYISFLLIGVFLYEFFSATMRGGSNSVIYNESLIKTISFPRLALPVSAVIRELINIAFVLLVMVILLVVIPVKVDGQWELANPVQWSWLLIVPIMVLYTLFCFGVAAFCGRLTVHFRDFTSFLPFIRRLLMYGSGVIFALENLLSDYPTALHILQFNPIHAFLALARGAFLSEYPVVTQDWFVALGATAIMLPLGVWYFWRGEQIYGRSE
ncbi:MAG: ABC transporter permease [Ancrocorticia sp.]|uniref:ABC transporter permease n=1 Tax=Ancrocorticia sp. TaxID=2593684 RepID=UPI003F8E606B